MLRGIQIVGILVGLFFLFQSYYMVKKKKGDVPDFLVWGFVGGGIVAVSAFPLIFDYLLGILQMKERPFAIFTVGILICYLFLFQMFKSLRGIKASISKLNESLSILMYEIEKEKEDK